LEGKSRGHSLTLQVSDYIKDYIVEHNLKEGDSIPSEGQIADSLGVSRSPVREAVKSLRSLGIVDVRHGEGLFVREWNFDPLLENLEFGIRTSPKKLAELYEIRKWLEMSVIEECVKRITDEDVLELEILMLQWEKAIKSGEDYILFDEKFHQTILGTMQNETLLKLFGAFWITFKHSKDSDLYSPENDRVLNEHRAIVTAIKERDGEQAKAAMYQQFIGFQDRIQQIVERYENDLSHDNK
jgi:DNA-binding FadR family transcriptional regulator